MTARAQRSGESKAPFQPALANRATRAALWWNGDVFEARALGRFETMSWRVWWLMPCAVLVWWISYSSTTPSWQQGDASNDIVHAGLRDIAARLRDEAVTLLPGFALGDTSLVDADLMQAMRDSGLAHLTAVSGANCIIPMTTAAVMSAWLGFTWRARIVGQMVALAVFAWAVWPQETVLRASLMLGLVLALRLIGRHTLGVPVLCCVVIGCLLVSPVLAHSLSFALSVAATLGILTLSPGIESFCSKWTPAGLAQGIAVSTSALTATAPLFLILGQSPSLVALPVNVLAAPGALWAAWWSTLAAPFASVTPIATTMLWIAQPGAWMVMQLAMWGAEHPLAVLAWPEGAVGVICAGAIVCLIVCAGWYRRNIRRVLRLVALALTLFVMTVTASWSIAHAARIPTNWDLVMCDVGQGDGLVVRGSGRVAVSDAGPDPLPMLRCLHDLGVERVDLLAISHFDHDHVGGVTKILQSMPVQVAIVPAAVDERLEAQQVMQALTHRGVRVVRMASGQQLRWGMATITALASKAEAEHDTRVDAAASAESMNDAGLVLQWQIPNGCSLVTLADLSEVAQRPLLDQAPDVDVVKVAHHGSKDFFTPLVTKLHASVALIGVGINSYGHPTPQAIAAWKLNGAAVYRTDKDGNIAVSCAADKIEVNTTR